MSTFEIGNHVKILSPLSSETIYVEDYETDIFEIVSKHKQLDLYYLKNLKEGTFLERAYCGNNLVKVK